MMYDYNWVTEWDKKPVSKRIVNLLIEIILDRDKRIMVAVGASIGLIILVIDILLRGIL